LKHFVVINPHSFTADSLKQFLADLDACFRAEGKVEYRTHISRYPRDAIAAISHYIQSLGSKDIVRVYAVGGDGILFDCLNGMVSFKNAELTSVPYGNSNDFIRAFGEKAAPAFRNIKKLINAPSRPVDIIHCGENYAINEVNIGLIGQSIVYANTLFPQLHQGFLRRNVGLAFSFCAIKAMFDDEIMRQHYTVIKDGEDFTGIYSNIHIANAPCNGGKMVPCPQAKPDDGVLEVIFLGAVNKFTAIKSLGSYQKGRSNQIDAYRASRCTSMVVSSNETLCAQLDGEGFYAKEIRLEVVPSGINFFAPEGIDFEDYTKKSNYVRVGESK